MYKTAYYYVKIDRRKPDITIDRYTYYINKRVIKKEFDDSSNGSGLNGYKISKNSDCNDNKSWIELSGVTANVALTFEEKGTYYLCVRDVAGNINTEKIEISNVIKDISYEYSCYNNLGTMHSLSSCTSLTSARDFEVKIITKKPLNSSSYIVDHGTTRNFNSFKLIENGSQYEYTIRLYSKKIIRDILVIQLNIICLTLMDILERL